MDNITKVNGWFDVCMRCLGLRDVGQHGDCLPAGGGRARDQPLHPLCPGAA